MQDPRPEPVAATHLKTAGIRTEPVAPSGLPRPHRQSEPIPPPLRQRIHTRVTDRLPRPLELRLSFPAHDTLSLPQTDTFTVIGTGDIMPGTNFPDTRYLPPGGDCARLFDPVRSILQDADVTFGNLEGVLAGKEGEAKNCNNPETCYVFRMPDHTLECVIDAGYDVLSVANNHVNDFGYAGRMRTARKLEEAGIPFAGFRSHPTAVFEKNGLTWGFAAFAPHRGTMDLKDYAGAAAIVRELEKTCDIVLVSFHGGGEGKDHQHVPCTDEVYLGYNRGNVCRFARAVVDAGADIVFGHGPHVTRAMELYNDRLICYSLGNFCTYARFNLQGPNGIAPIVKVYTDRTGKFLEGEVIPVRQPGEGGPRPDPQRRVISKLQTLNAADFPGSMLRLRDDGRLVRVQIPPEPQYFSRSAYAEPDTVEIFNGTFLGGDGRNYYGNEAPSDLEVVWRHYLGEGETVISRNLGSRTWKGAGWTGQPLMVREDNDTFLVQGANDHHLKKINARDGSLVWQYPFDDVIKGTGTLWFNRTETDPAKRWIILQGSRLGVGNYLDSPVIPSYRAVSYLTGRELWRHHVKWSDSYSRDVDASALVHNDTAYIGLENSWFTVFNPDPDSAYRDGRVKHPLLYRQRLLYHPEDVKKHRYNVVTESSPCRIGRMIYVASGSGHVWGYDMDRGELTWDFHVGSDMDGSAVATSDSCLLVSVEKQYIDGPGGIFKLDPSRPPEEAVVWFFPVRDTTYASWEGGVIGTAAVTDRYNDRNLAAFSAIDGNLYVVRHDSLSGQTATGPDGETRYPVPARAFRYRIGASISTPVFTADRLVAGGYGGLYLFGYRNDRFTLLDRRGGSFEATPFIRDNRIYVASRDGYLYCLGKKD